MTLDTSCSDTTTPPSNKIQNKNNSSAEKQQEENTPNDHSISNNTLDNTECCYPGTPVSIPENKELTLENLENADILLQVPNNDVDLNNILSPSTQNTNAAAAAAPYYRVGTPMSDTRSVGAEDFLQEAAKVAVEARLSDLGPNVLPKRPALRDSIRLIHAHSQRDLPAQCFVTATKAKYKRSNICLSMDRDVIAWTKNEKPKGFLDTDDVIAASVVRLSKLQIHYFIKPKTSKPSKMLKRKLKTIEFDLLNFAAATRWKDGIQALVRWNARIPDTICKRKVKVVVNPHSGKKKAPALWKERVKPLLDFAEIDADVEETTYAGHAIDMGKNFKVDDKYETIVFISGDGTINEYMNGLLSRPEDEWRKVVVSTPISLISAGTQNAFGSGVGIPTLEAAVYSIIKRKMRPIDVITATRENTTDVQYSCCGLGWAIAGDIAAASEAYRFLGVYRYDFLKLKFAIFPKKHSGTISYVESNPKPVLRRYDEIRNLNVTDQHVIERETNYDDPDHDHLDHAWDSLVGAVRNPASEERYPEDDGNWTSESGKYIAFGSLTSAPDGIYSHPSDGHMDLIIARKGNIFKMLHMAFCHIIGKPLKSKLISYKKVKAVVLSQNEKENVMNIDGEVFPGPGPWRMEVVPSLFKVLSEK